MALGDVYKKVGGTWALQGNIRGPQGVQGDAGASGADGATWFAQAAQPTANGPGDLWLDTDDGAVYEWDGASWGSPIANLTGPTGATGPTGDPGPTGDLGADGADGATWFAQSAQPTATGTGDLWLDTDDGAVYRWDGSSWGSPIASLVGPTGATGAAGADGADGSVWHAGSTAAGGVDGDFFLITS